jgi:hypothetical protein
MELFCVGWIDGFEDGRGFVEVLQSDQVKPLLPSWGCRVVCGKLVLSDESVGYRSQDDAPLC